jgi:hypothetical protein
VFPIITQNAQLEELIGFGDALSLQNRYDFEANFLKVFYG